MRVTARELAEMTGGKLEAADPERFFTGFASLNEAEESDVSFLGNSKYGPMLRTTKAGLVLVDVTAEPPPAGTDRIVVENASAAFGKVVSTFAPKPTRPPPGADSSAVIDETANVDLSAVSVGPYAIIGPNVVIGSGTVIGSHVVIAEGSVIGKDCLFHSHVSIRERSEIGDRVIIHDNSVIGADGFGYEFVEGRFVKVDQVGIVRIGNDVEIGACVAIDRARFGRTEIGDGTKIDNLVQIGHNVRIGKHCVFAGQVGIAGSTHIGDYVTVGGQAGVAGHLTVADRSVLGAKVGLTKSITKPGLTWMGFPAQPAQEWREDFVRGKIAARKIEAIKALERRLKEEGAD